MEGRLSRVLILSSSVNKHGRHSCLQLLFLHIFYSFFIIKYRLQFMLWSLFNKNVLFVNMKNRITDQHNENVCDEKSFKQSV